MGTNEIFESRIVRYSGDIRLIEISPDKYCVAKVTKNWFGKSKTEYFNLAYQGTGISCKDLIDNLTIGSFDRCQHIYNCNLLIKN